MPGPVIGRHELHQRAIAPDQEMRRYPQLAQLIKIGVGIEVEPVTEQVGNIRAAEFAGRQADIVDHQQVDRAIGRPRVAVRRRFAQRLPAPAVGSYHEGRRFGSRPHCGSWIFSRCIW